ncbi:DUF2238 domain-containing protein [Candidatus Woesearchaeota archaeon]|nr:DUF2238 domain-containing protein [Candidatus Woesearchaeota archaeon]
MKKKPNKKKEKTIISIIFLIFSLAFLIISVLNHNYEYIYYNLLMLVGFFILLFFYEKIHLKTPLLIGLIVLTFLHLAGGNLTFGGLKLYQTSLLIIPYDKIVHVFGAFIITLIAYNFIQESLVKKDMRKTILISFIVLMIGIGLGAIIEIIEFLATLVFQNTLVGDYANNAADLIANSIGALVAVIFSLSHSKKK